MLNIIIIVIYLLCYYNCVILIIIHVGIYVPILPIHSAERNYYITFINTVTVVHLSYKRLLYAIKISV